MVTASMPRVVLDTTVINHLEDGREESEPLMRGLELGYDVRLPAMVVDEIFATKSAERRDALLRRFARILANAKCIWPPNEVLRLHVRVYQENPRAYDWNRVHVRAREYEQAVLSRTLPEDLFAETRKLQFHLHKEFEQAWTSLRPKLAEIITRDPRQRLNSFEEAAHASTKPGGVLWGFGIGLFQRALEGNAAEMTDEQIRHFIDASPPFRAVCYSFVKAWYNFSLSPAHDATPKAGRNDLMMSAYLPYCDKFLTADYAQRTDLQDIAGAAGLDCSVVSLREFSSSFELCRGTPDDGGFGSI
jgi:hypothetical protein